MDERERARQREAEHERYAHGLPDYHDPFAGFGGAPQAISALTLRLVLAIIGLVMAVGGAILLAVADAPVGFVVFMCLAAAVLLVDIIVISYRKHRGEPG
jgi:hypothetical protein